ncbi:MAG TPA: N-acetyltransferase DgcN [Thermohalobaculum sp.]|nr:N-acetyltransferase DgcN [Thermohalobaculum sp.]
MSIPQPYLLFLGDAPDQLAAKVAQGIRDWRPGTSVGQLRLPGCSADMELDDMTVAEGAAAGARTLVIGVANRGGFFSDAWKAVMIEALEAGMDVAAGLHTHLNADPDLAEAARRTGRTLHDVRVPKGKFPIADGQSRAGKRLLAVGTDCSCGKMYATLALEAAMQERGMNADFRATGQTGILIEGEGVPLDAVVADFMAGAVEALTPANDPEHWDIIEGQGSLFHPSYSGVTLALIHGGQPDALVLCHEPTRTHLRGLPHYAVPTLEELRELALTMARMVNPDCRVVGCAINTKALGEAEAEAHLAETEKRLGLPCVDPYRHGAGRLVDAL